MQFYCTLVLLSCTLIKSTLVVTEVTTSTSQTGNYYNYSINRVQHQSTTENEQIHFDNQDETWPQTDSQPPTFSCLSINWDIYETICARCRLTNLDCNLNSLVNCLQETDAWFKFLPILKTFCNDVYQCSIIYPCPRPDTICFEGVCVCNFHLHTNFARNQCQLYHSTTEPPTTQSIKEQTNNYDDDDYGNHCISPHDCKWTNIACVQHRCECPADYKQDRSSRRCVWTYYNDEYKTNKKYIIGIGVSLVCIICCIATCICLGRRDGRNTSRRNSRPLGVDGTSSMLELLGELNDLPPDYSDVYMIEPQERTHEQRNKLPSYEEAMRQSEFNSQPLHAVVEDSAVDGGEGSPRSSRPSTSFHDPSAHSSVMIEQSPVNFRREESATYEVVNRGYIDI